MAGPNEAGQFDNFYYTICNDTGGIQGLLNSLFSFLIRRTDFFYECNPGDKMGFPPGVNQTILFQIFDSYRQEHYQKFPKKSAADYQDLLKKYQDQQKELMAAEKPAQIPVSESQPVSVPPSVNPDSIKTESQETTKLTEEVQVDKKPEVIEKQPVNPKQTVDISTYNGAQTEKYLWSQSITDVTVQVNLPQGTTKQDLVVELQKNHIKLKLKNETESQMEGELYDLIDVDDSSWSLEDGNKIVFVLEKSRENIWKTVIKGDVEIDATQVDNSKPLNDFDPQTQGALRKIMYEQQRKQMGLPTTEQEKQLQMMKKAWDAEGSPFKGQPFDPSRLNLPTPDILGNMN